MRAGPIAAFFVCLSVGCGGVPKKPALMESLARSEISVAQLRAIDYEFASRFSQLVARCAEEILHTTEEREQYRRALLWRMYASPQARTAAFNQDPLAGLLELWALAGQQQEYFTVGEGKNAFGGQWPCVLETVHTLAREASELAFDVLPLDEAQKMQTRVQEWVEAHPIEGEFYVRPTAQAGLAAFVGDAEGGLRAVGSMEETLRDLNDRIAILSVQLPTEARWQADYLVNTLLEEHVADAAGSLLASMERISTSLDDFDQVVSLQTSRLVEGLRREREAAFAGIEVERDHWLEAMDRLKRDVLFSIDAELEEALDRFEATGRGLIDHFFERLVAVLIGIGIFILVVVAILVGALRRRSRPAPPPEPRGDDGN